MAGRSDFTSAEAEELRRLIREKQTADRDRQKALRSRMRGIGFYISDFADYLGFTVSDFDDLIARGAVRISGPETSPKKETAVPARTQSDSEQITWYSELREQYRPASLRVLLVAESPPDPGAGGRRFFYSPTLSQHDNLYRGVAEAVYGERAVRDKPGTLSRLQAEGFWLIDAVQTPINRASTSERSRALHDAAPALAKRCLELSPTRGVVICHGGVYKEVADCLRAADVSVLHDQPIPFPLGNWRAKFVTEFREALRSDMR